MSDFSTTASIEVELDRSSLRSVRGELEDLGAVEVGVPDGGTPAAQSGGGGRQRRRRRREFRWSRQRTEHLEEIVDVLGDIEENVGGGGGGMGILGDMLGVGAGGVAGGITSGLTSGAATAIGAAAGSAVGSVVADELSDASVQLEEPEWAPLLVEKPEWVPLEATGGGGGGSDGIIDALDEDLPFTQTREELFGDIELPEFDDIEVKVSDVTGGASDAVDQGQSAAGGAADTVADVAGQINPFGGGGGGGGGSSSPDPSDARRRAAEFRRGSPATGASSAATGPGQRAREQRAAFEEMVNDVTNEINIDADLSAFVDDVLDAVEPAIGDVEDDLQGQIDDLERKLRRGSTP